MSLCRFVPWLLLTVLVGFGAAPLDAQQSSSDEPSWKWPESRWRDAVAKVRAGRSLLPESWPEGARVAVTLSFDFDNETLSLRDGRTSPSLLSSGASNSN